MGTRIGRKGARMVMAAAVVVAMAPRAAATEGPPDRRLSEQLTAIDAAETAHDCPKAVRLGEALLAERRGKLPGRLEAALEAAVAECAYDTGAKDKAYAHALRGTRFDESPDALWHLRLFLEMDAGKFGPAVATVEAMSQGRGAALNATPMSWLYRLNRETKDAGLSAERLRLLKVLAEDAYIPAESSGDAQGLHQAYAEALAAAGDRTRAATVLATVWDPGLIIDSLFDPRLAPLLPAKLDLRAVAETALVKDREIAERHPERLDPAIAVSTDLRRLGRPHEALALLEPLLAGDTGRFEDANTKLQWVWDEVARANESLGRYETAAKALAAGAALAEKNGGDNVSQLINLAHLQIRFGHPEDALKTLAAFDDPARKASPYGTMEMRLARGCAHAAAGHAAAAAADLAYAEAHPKDHPGALGYLDLCVGRMDEAAAFFIARLADPDRRSVTLRDLSDYDPPPGALPPLFGGKIETLKARADVKAAIARAGGIRRIPLQPTDR